MMAAETENAGMPVTWRVGLEAVPDEADLLADLSPIAGPMTGEPLGVATLFEQLRAQEDYPIETCAHLKERITFNALKNLARGIISHASIMTIGRLLDPSKPTGFVWPKSIDGPMGKRKQGGNGNNKVTVLLEQQLQDEQVEPLNAQTFQWADAVFEGVPRLGEAEKINNHLATLFDNTWLAQNAVRLEAT